MKYLWSKLRRDLIKMFPQFIAVFVMALLSITIFSGMESVWIAMENQSNNFYREANLAEAWVYGSPLDKEVMDKILKLKNVTAVTNSMSIVMDVMGEGDKHSDVNLITINDTKNQNPVVLEGDKFDTSTKGIWIDRTYAEKHGLKVGDTITVSYGELPKTTMTIQGLVMSPEFIYYTGSATETMPNYEKHGYGYISEKQIKDITGSILYNQIRISCSSDCDYETLEKDISEQLGDNFYCMQTREDFSSIAQMKDEINQAKRMAILFTFVFVLLALLTMYTTMSRLVRNQLMQIGTMKAIGIKSSVICLHYMMYGFVVPLLGAVLGVPFGKVTVGNVVMAVKKTTLQLPEWKLQSSYGTYFLIILIVAICSFATLWTAQGALKETPAETMQGNGRKKKERKSKKIGSTKGYRSYTLTWVKRDVGRNKLRYLIGVIGVMGSMMLMIAGFGMYDSINASNDYVFTKQYSYTYNGHINRYSKKVKNAIEDKAKEAELQWMTQNAVDIAYNGDNEISSVITILESGKYMYFENAENDEKLNLPDKGVVLSRKLANQIGATVDDEITFNVTGIAKTFKAKVEGITSVRTPQGIYLSDKSWNDLGQEFQPTSILMDDGGQKALKDSQLLSELTSIDVQKDNINELSESCNTVIKLLILASFLLSIVILYNIGMMNYEERYREYATMKVIGYNRNEIRKILLTDCMFTALPGWLIGIPVGFLFLKVFINVVSFDSYEWRMILEWPHFILVSIFVIACAIIVNLIICRKVNRIIMTEALKSVE